MTIGTGVLASSDEGVKASVYPDHVILIADTMGSFGDEYSHARLHKTFIMPDVNLYATAANRIDKAAELVPMIHYQLTLLDLKTRSYGDVLRAINKACFLYKVECFSRSVLPKYRIPPELFDPFKATAEINALLQPEWEKFDIECDLLVGSFTGHGQAFLVSVHGNEGSIGTWNFPGFYAIGTGAPNAMFWLSHRGHTLGMSPLRAAYHAYEAKLMADDAPNVNDHLDVVIANVKENWHFTSHGRKSKSRPHPTITIKELSKMFKRYGHRSTERLDPHV